MSEELHVPYDRAGPVTVIWRVSGREVVEQGQVVCELEADRASVELNAPWDCVIEPLVTSWTELKPGDRFARVHRA